MFKIEIESALHLELTHFSHAENLGREKGVKYFTFNYSLLLLWQNTP